MPKDTMRVVLYVDEKTYYKLATRFARHAKISNRGRTVTLGDMEAVKVKGTWHFSYQGEWFGCGAGKFTREDIIDFMAGKIFDMGSFKDKTLVGLLLKTPPTPT